MPVSQIADHPTPGVVHLDSARIQRAESPAGQIEELQAKLEGERNAGKAVLAAMLELERRLDTERSTGQALLATVRELGTSLEEARRIMREQRGENERLRADGHGLAVALREAERPLWHKLLRRR